MNTTLNETLGQAADKAGNATSTALLNFRWEDAATSIIKDNLGFNISNEQIAIIVPILALALIWWKWRSIISWIGELGSTLILLTIIYLILKGAGIL